MVQAISSGLPRVNALTIVPILRMSNLFPVVLEHLMGRHVVYLQASGAMAAPRTMAFMSRLGVDRLDPRCVMGLSSHIGEDRTDTLARDLMECVAGADGFTRFARLLPKVVGREGKARLLCYGVFAEHVRHFAEALGVAEHLRDHGRKADVLCAVSPIGALVFCENLTPCANRVLPGHPGLAFAWSVMGAAGKAAAGITRRVTRRLGGHQGVHGRAQQESEPIPDSTACEGATAQVVYFPHKGLGYGTLFRKDYFYADDPTSAFHPSNIRHVELSTPDADVAESYHQAGVSFEIFEPFAGERLRPFIDAVRAVHESMRGYNRREVVAAMAAVTVLFRVHRAVAASMCFYGVKVALVGYDFLFPKTLAYALQVHGLKLVSVQERWNSALRQHLQVMSDIYFAVGEKCVERLKDDSLNQVQRYVIIEPIRCALIRSYTREQLPNFGFSGDGRHKVLVLDYHSDNSENAISPLMWSSWENNRLFYEDVIRLAAAHPECEFVIRGKNDQWMALPYFSDLVAAVTSAPNILVNRDYESLNVSYRLAVAADIIVARYTSLCDEALACGIPVLVYQRLVNGACTLEAWDTYPDIPLVLHDYDSLVHRFTDVLQGKDFLNAQQHARLEEYYYGKDEAQPKIRQELDALLEQDEVAQEKPGLGS